MSSILSGMAQLCKRDPSQSSNASQVLFELGYNIVKAALDSDTQPLILQILPVWQPTAESPDSSAADRQRMQTNSGWPTATYARQQMRMVSHGGQNLTDAACHTYQSAVPDCRKSLECDDAAASDEALAQRYVWDETNSRLDSAGKYDAFLDASLLGHEFCSQAARRSTTTIQVLGPGCPDLKDIPGDFAKHVSTVCLYPTYSESVDYSVMLRDLPRLRWLVLGGLQPEFAPEPWGFDGSDLGIDLLTYSVGMQGGVSQAFEDILATVKPYMGLSSFTGSTGASYVVRQFELTHVCAEFALVLVVGSRIPCTAGGEPDVFIAYATTYSSRYGLDPGSHRPRSKLQREVDALAIPRFSEAFMIQMVRNLVYERARGNSDIDALDWTRYKNMFIDQGRQMAGRELGLYVDEPEMSWDTSDAELHARDLQRSRFIVCPWWMSYSEALVYCAELWRDWKNDPSIHPLRPENGVVPWHGRPSHITRFWPSARDFTQ